jgi:hypothetical protein
MKVLNFKNVVKCNIKLIDINITKRKSYSNEK